MQCMLNIHNHPSGQCSKNILRRLIGCVFVVLCVRFESLRHPYPVHGTSTKNHFVEYKRCVHAFIGRLISGGGEWCRDLQSATRDYRTVYLYISATYVKRWTYRIYGAPQYHLSVWRILSDNNNNKLYTDRTVHWTIIVRHFFLLLFGSLIKALCVCVCVYKAHFEALVAYAIVCIYSRASPSRTTVPNKIIIIVIIK